MARPKKNTGAAEDATKTDELKTTSNLTPDEATIRQRSESQDIDWFTIREDELNDFSLMQNPFDLPPEAAKMQNERRYAFRFCTRTPQRVDELTRSKSPPLRWAIVNKATLPQLGHLVDPVLGCIAVEDQVLLFKPWHHHAIVQKAKADMAAAQSNPLEQAANRIADSNDGYVPRAARVGLQDSDPSKIGKRDVVMQDEADWDKAAGEVDDTSELGDLVAED